MESWDCKDCKSFERGSAQLTFILVCIGFAIDKADAALLPAVYKELCETFDVGPQFLGTITLARGLTQSIVSIAAGPLSRRFDRTRVIGWGIIGWGVATALVGVAGSSTTLLLARAANGAGLGIVIPVAFALVSDLFCPSLRGRAFGAMYFAGHAGALLGAFFATQLAAQQDGWRLAFYIFGAISVLLGAVVLLAARDTMGRAPVVAVSAGSTGRDLLAVVRIRSLQVIIVQGMFGSMPWFALGFFTLWLEILGFSNSTASVIRLLLDLGTCVGTLLSGARPSPESPLLPSRYFTPRHHVCPTQGF